MVVTPWRVSGAVDYNRLIEQFGTSPITQGIRDRMEKHAGYLHAQLRRRVFFSHRDMDWWLDTYDRGEPVGLYTGRGPSGPVHLGHLLPWFFTKYLQDVYGADLYFQMTDDEKFLLHDRLTLDETIGYTYDNSLDLIAVGLDAEKTHIISDTDNIDHLYRLGLEVAKRVTYSTIKGLFGLQDSDNIGIIFYPAIQAVPCFIQSVREERKVAVLIPAAIDQDPYWRMTRDIAEKMGYYKPAQMRRPAHRQGAEREGGRPDGLQHLRLPLLPLRGGRQQATSLGERVQVRLPRLRGLQGTAGEGREPIPRRIPGEKGDGQGRLGRLPHQIVSQEV